VLSSGWLRVDASHQAARYQLLKEGSDIADHSFIVDVVKLRQFIAYIANTARFGKHIPNCAASPVKAKASAGTNAKDDHLIVECRGEVSAVLDEHGVDRHGHNRGPCMRPWLAGYPILVGILLILLGIGVPRG
jgi:hypothetical protein